MRDRQAFGSLDYEGGCMFMNWFRCRDESDAVEASKSEVLPTSWRIVALCSGGRLFIVSWLRLKTCMIISYKTSSSDSKHGELGGGDDLLSESR
jgi:hypothetical protein